MNCHIIEESMLSFELSAIDLILVIAVTILLILYITKMSTKAALEERLLVSGGGQEAEKERLLVSGGGQEAEKERLLVSGGGQEAEKERLLVSGGGQEAEKERLLVSGGGQEAEKERLSRSPTLKTSFECLYNFGYLRKLGRDAVIPDGCLGCPRIMDCYSVNK
jgi:hypothetical protein